MNPLQGSLRLSLRIGIRAFALLVLLALGLGVVAEPALAAESKKAILVLDGSGSMWGQIDGKAKVEIARDVVADLLKDWDDSVELGLSVYGHRRKGDCADIELLIPASKVDKDAFMKTVNGIQPKGKTPLSAAVKQAAEALKYSEEAATVILITDGKETCDMDPCALASQLEKQGVDFTTHVIGFDLQAEEEANLACIAKETGGKFLSASNATELHTAITKAVTIVAQAEPKPAKAEKPGLKLKATLKDSGDFLTEGVHWDVYEAQQDINGNRKRIADSWNAQPFFEIPPGKYFIAVQHGNATASLDVELPPETTMIQIVNLHAGYLKLGSILTTGADFLAEGVHYDVYEAQKDINGNRKRISDSWNARALFYLNVGDYFIAVQHGNATASGPVTIRAGELTEQTFDLNAGYLKLASIIKEGAAPLAEGVHFDVYEAKKDINGNRKRVNDSWNANPLFYLNVGEYYIATQHGNSAADGTVTILPGELTEKTFNLHAGYLKLSAVLKAGVAPLVEGVHYDVYEAKKDIHGNRKRVNDSWNANPIFYLNAGNYHIAVQHGNATVSADLTAVEGEIVEETLDLKAGYLKLQFKDGGNILTEGVHTDVYEDAKDMHGNRKRVNDSWDASPIFYLNTGKYFIVSTHGEDRIEKTVNIVEGETNELMWKF